MVFVHLGGLLGLNGLPEAPRAPEDAHFEMSYLSGADLGEAPRGLMTFRQGDILGDPPG